MIKKIKEVCIKNKQINEKEIVEEQERKRKLDNQKALLRHEILKQIEEDEKQKSILEGELKKAEDLQKLLIDKNVSDQECNKIQDKNFNNELNFPIKKNHENNKKK